MARQAKRREIGALKANRVAETTAVRYYKHVYWYWIWMAMNGIGSVDNWEQMDAICSDYIEFLWDANQNLSMAADTLSGLQHVLMTRGKLPISWGFLTIWRSKEPPSRAPPMSELMALAIAAQWAFVQGNAGPAVGILLAFYGFLRVGEMFKLISANVIFAADMSSLVLNLGETKGGKRKGVLESVVIDDSVTVWATWLWLRSRPATAPIIEVSPHVWRRL